MPPKKQQKREEEESEEEPSSSGSEQSSSGSEDGSEDDSEFPDVSDAEEDSSDADEDIEEIQVEFEFFTPEEKDFLGLKNLLAPYLNGQEFDSSALIDAIIAEGDVGSVVKTDSDDDPIAIMSVLSTHKYKEANFMRQIRQFLLDSCPKQAIGAKLADLCKQAFDSKGTGLVLNERFINAPPKLSPPLVMFLMDAIKERAQPGVGADGAGPSSGSGGKGDDNNQRPAKKQKQEEVPSTSASQPLPAAAEIIFTRPEDEYFHQHCSWYYTFPVESRPVGKDGLQQCRLVMQIDIDQIPAAQKVLDEEVGNMAKDGGSNQQEMAKTAEEATDAAAAAGAGKGAGKKKKTAQGKAKAIQL
ncbi:p21-C-terminal region-binding protein-domain-containing protein [Dunaliella salina]|uniref:P21-C-terminal region-binding protein-domain-containing protein n=1 Tax=Dunaliella salina TaxID=3046 RepID=A0ABQ7FXI4_DUNSA|nr:p21-C-terminal region-binding protein-domain-containing protein [Dunaliella salina]|eukprot:KAF5827059.1 p21-C-terminal region-binding protein-domain-containing protein [Dunaliella salina]